MGRRATQIIEPDIVFFLVINDSRNSFVIVALKKGHLFEQIRSNAGNYFLGVTNNIKVVCCHS